MAAIPFVKLGALLIKTIAKPITKQFIDEAKTRKPFGFLCGHIGQFSHQIVSRLNILGSGYKFLKVKPLETVDAVVKGAEVLSETILFSVAGGLLIYEYIRTKNKENIEKARLADQRVADIESHTQQVALLQDRLSDAEKRIIQLEDSRAWSKISRIFASDGSNKQQTSNGDMTKSAENAADSNTKALEVSATLDPPQVIDGREIVKLPDVIDKPTVVTAAGTSPLQTSSPSTLNTPPDGLVVGADQAAVPLLTDSWWSWLFK